MEMDLKMPNEEKEKHMVAWWEGNMKLFANMRLQREDYGRVVLNSRILFRHGITELLSLGHSLQLPFYIVSGGMAEIIEASFYAILHNGETGNKEDDLRDYWHKQVQILSNKFIYHDNVGIDFERPIIHILNKQQFIYDQQAKRSFRKNVIVMGDILDDVKMVDHSRHETVLKIGFLNDPIHHQHLVEEFKKAYDIVITDDGSLQPVNYLIQKTFNMQQAAENEPHHDFKELSAVLA